MDNMKQKTYAVRVKKEFEQDLPNLAGKVLHWTMEQILNEINRDRSDDWTAYNETDWREGLTEWTWFEPIL